MVWQNPIRRSSVIRLWLGQWMLYLVEITEHFISWLLVTVVSCADCNLDDYSGLSPCVQGEITLVGWNGVAWFLSSEPG